MVFPDTSVVFFFYLECPLLNRAYEQTQKLSKDANSALKMLIRKQAKLYTLLISILSKTKTEGVFNVIGLDTVLPLHERFSWIGRIEDRYNQQRGETTQITNKQSSFKKTVQSYRNLKTDFVAVQY